MGADDPSTLPTRRAHDASGVAIRVRSEAIPTARPSICGTASPARATEHALSIALACNFASILYQYHRERDAVAEIETARLEYVTRHDFDLVLLLGAVRRGWLAGEDGRGEEGLAQIRTASRRTRRSGPDRVKGARRT